MVQAMLKFMSILVDGHIVSYCDMLQLLWSSIEALAVVTSFEDKH